MSNQQKNSIGARHNSLGSTAFPDEMEHTAPSAFNRNATPPTTFPTTQAGTNTTAAPGGLRSILGSLTGAFGGTTTHPSAPSALRPIKTPHESPSHPEMVFSPTDVGVWEFSRFTPATPKNNQHSLDDVHQTMRIVQPFSTTTRPNRPSTPHKTCVRTNAESTRADGPISSPFSRADVHRTIGDAPSAPQQITIETVDQVLNEVRPYLMADGGNVRVADVQGGRVLLELEGACGTCASSSATMKMGIERSLKAAFGDALEEVVQVNAQHEGSATRDAVDSHLDMLRGAIVSLGGSVEVLLVENGCATLRYKGPASIGTGIKAAIRDKFPDVTEVVFVEE